jgi:hypothetical protein
LLPLEWSFGVSPSQAEQSRAVRNAATSGVVTAKALEAIGPSPGIVARRRASGSFFCAASTRCVIVSIRARRSRS